MTKEKAHIKKEVKKNKIDISLNIKRAAKSKTALFPEKLARANELLARMGLISEMTFFENLNIPQP